MDFNRMSNNMNFMMPEQRMMNSGMDFNFLQQMANHMDYLDTVQRMYPDAYRRMMPYVDRISYEIDDPTALTESDMTRITHDIVHRSNILSDPPAGHNETTLMDLAGVMLLARLFNGEMPYTTPFTMPLALPLMSPYGRLRRPMRGRFY